MELGRAIDFSRIVNIKEKKGPPVLGIGREALPGKSGPGSVQNFSHIL